MLFNSETYVAFLPAVVILHWLLRPQMRPFFLLVASYVFYAYWNPPFLLLVVGMTVANFGLGLTQARRRSAAVLVAAIVLDLGLLAVFKYIGLLDDSARRLASLFGIPATLPVVQAALPLGLSFFTFEFIHYQVDVYRGQEPIRSPIRFALFPAFFPTQIAGPIKRYEDFDPQVRSLPKFDPVLFAEGVELIARGFFKKVVLADNLLPIASTVFGSPATASATDTWVGLLAFSFQIYLDFSGYTDIGRGSAQLLGYRVPENFGAPYLATDPQDFWRRWHITLSMWLRDYLYIPLGGNRAGKWRTRFNLMVTMALGGLWHGPAFHFVAWGVGHGLVLVSRRLAGEVGLPRVPAWVGWASTQFAVLLLWGLFRAPGLAAAATMLTHLLFGGLGLRLVTAPQALLVLEIAAGALILQWLLARIDWRAIARSSTAAAVMRPAFIAVLLFVSVYAGGLADTTHRFIYFQF